MKAKKKRVAKAASATKPPKRFPNVKNEGLRLALEAAGGYTELAAALGMTRQGIHKWDEVPDRFAPKIEELYDIPRSKVAPHLYL